MKIEQNTILYCPSFSIASIPYIKAYFRNIPITSDINECKNYSTILFSWAFFWEDLSWIHKLNNKKIIIGGRAVKCLAIKNKLSFFQNVEYFPFDIDYPEYKETRIVPDYSTILKNDPNIDYLQVYSGNGCPWNKCTFCNWGEGISKYVQFSPEYIANIINHVSRYGKISELSCPVHKVDWLRELESFLPSGKFYYAYVSAKDRNWDKLKKARVLFVGSEYLSNKVLKRIQKEANVREIIDSICSILSSGIEVVTNIIEDLTENPKEILEHTENKKKLLKEAQKRGRAKLWLMSGMLAKKEHYSINNGQYYAFPENTIDKYFSIGT